MKEILCIPLTPNPTADKLIWTGNKAGSYSVKSGYNSLCSLGNSSNANQASPSYQPPRILWTTIWQLHTNPKIRFFLWSACNNALSTKENPFGRKMVLDPLCPVYRLAPETPEHLLILCDWTKHIWLDPRLNCDTSPAKVTRIDKWVLENLSAGADPSSRAIFDGVLWSIWKGRNDVVFRNQKPNSSHLIEEVVNSYKLVVKWNPSKGNRARDSSLLRDRWIPLPDGSWKLNVDACWCEGSWTGAIARVYRDSRGLLIEGFAKKIHAPSALATEVLAL